MLVVLSIVAVSFSIILALGIMTQEKHIAPEPSNSDSKVIFSIDPKPIEPVSEGSQLAITIIKRPVKGGV